MYPIKNFIVDIFENSTYDIHVSTEYVSENSYTVSIQRLDTINNEGWDYNLKIFVYSPIYLYYEIIEIGSSSVSNVKKLLTINRKIEPNINEIENRTYRQYEKYHHIEPNFQKVELDEFNELFDAEMIVLPESFYAVGIKNDKTYIYNQKYILYYEIAPTMQFIINMIRYYKIEKLYNCYFVICACDGFPENTHYSLRNKIIRSVKKEKYIGKFGLDFHDIPSNKLEKLHRKKWILCQNNHKQNAYLYTKPLPDHHYFVLNEYRDFRWLHNGSFFHEKIPKIIFASTKSRSSKYNFKKTPIINGIENKEITQREMFYKLFENYPNIVSIESGWQKNNFISSKEQIKYKYILDMDGLASTWDSFAWKLRSGSLLMRVDGIWNQWFFDKLKEWVHYVPIKEDFSDLMEKYYWCEYNPEKCKEIIYNACEFFETYRLYNTEEYIKNEIFTII
jgi:hypothetical protein